MLTLHSNITIQQALYLTLQEARKWLGASPEYYLFVAENQLSHRMHYCILNVEIDNPRYTKVLMSYNVDDALNGEPNLNETGRYNYFVYGQSSSTNLSPTDASVYGEMERGILNVIEDDSIFSPATLNIPTDIVYYE